MADTIDRGQARLVILTKGLARELDWPALCLQDRYLNKASDDISQSGIPGLLTVDSNLRDCFAAFLV